jgi:negative regulator of sigma E activity
MSSLLARSLAGTASSAFSSLQGALRHGSKRAWKPTRKTMAHTRNGPTWPKGTIKDWAKRWWQPVLPVLAAAVAAGVTPGGAHGQGSSRARKRALQKQQQMMAHHARRMEGVARNKLFREQQLDRERERTNGYLQEYASMLRVKAGLTNGAPTPAGAPAR